MSSLTRRSKWILLSTVAGASLAADLLTKWLAHAMLPANGRPVTVVEGYWDFVLAFNEGAAFSILENVAIARVLLSAVGLVAIAAILFMARDANRARAVVPLGMILGGAVGNLFERIAFGKVTDFVLWHYHEHRWPVFNIADVALVIGVALVLINIVTTRKPEAAAKGG